MRASRRFLMATIAVLCCSNSIILAQSELANRSDQAAAERILGPHWKQLSRRAGMVFSGTAIGTKVLEVRTDQGVPAITLTFRVERAVIGVEAGRAVTIRQWAGAPSQLRLVRDGEHVLLFLYPPSRLGLTSPVGGAQGLIQLNAQTSDAALTQLERAIRTARQEE